MKTNNYTPGNPGIWSGRVDSNQDPEQLRFHQKVKCVTLENIAIEAEHVLLGFASDEGVRRNKGRTGASGGPDYFRKNIGSLCWHGSEAGFADAGNITLHRNDLEAGQQELANTVSVLLQKGKKPFIIGGGHETAFGHFMGITQFLRENEPDAKIGILNIDAHFDLRAHNGNPHSGSPFLQAHELAEELGIDLSYFVYGINTMSNTPTLFKKADELGVGYCTNKEIFRNEADAIQKLRYFLDSRTHIYLTICLDVFEAHLAPGVSAPAWNGIQLRHAQRVLELVKRTAKLISMDVCELNPLFDKDNRTAKLAGTLFFDWMMD